MSLVCVNRIRKVVELVAGQRGEPRLDVDGCELEHASNLRRICVLLYVLHVKVICNVLLYIYLYVCITIMCYRSFT